MSELEKLKKLIRAQNQRKKSSKPVNYKSILKRITYRMIEHFIKLSDKNVDPNKVLSYYMSGDIGGAIDYILSHAVTEEEAKEIVEEIKKIVSEVE